MYILFYSYNRPNELKTISCLVLKQLIDMLDQGTSNNFKKLESVFSTQTGIKEFITAISVLHCTCITKHESVSVIFIELKIMEFLKSSLLKIKNRLQEKSKSEITDLNALHNTDVLRELLSSIADLNSAVFDLSLEDIGDQSFLFEILGQVDYSLENHRVLGKFISQIIRDFGKSVSFTLKTITSFHQAGLMERILKWVTDCISKKNIEKAFLLFSLVIQLLKVFLDI